MGTRPSGAVGNRLPADGQDLLRLFLFFLDLLLVDLRYQSAPADLRIKELRSAGTPKAVEVELRGRQRSFRPARGACLPKKEKLSQVSAPPSAPEPHQATTHCKQRRRPETSIASLSTPGHPTAPTPARTGHALCCVATTWARHATADLESVMPHRRRKSEATMTSAARNCGRATAHAFASSQSLPPLSCRAPVLWPCLRGRPSNTRALSTTTRQCSPRVPSLRLPKRQGRFGGCRAKLGSLQANVGRNWLCVGVKLAEPGRKLTELWPMVVEPGPIMFEHELNLVEPGPTDRMVDFLSFSLSLSLSLGAPWGGVDVRSHGASLRAASVPHKFTARRGAGGAARICAGADAHLHGCGALLVRDLRSHNHSQR